MIFVYLTFEFVNIAGMIDFDSEEIDAVSGEALFDLNKLPGHSHEAEVYPDENSENEDESIEQTMDEEPIHALNTNGSHHKFLSNEYCKAISHLLLLYSQGGRLSRRATRNVASMYSVSNSVIKRIWRKTKAGEEVCHKRTKYSGHKKVELDLDRFH